MSLGPSTVLSFLGRRREVVDLDSIFDHTAKKVKMHVFSDIIVFVHKSRRGRTQEIWSMKDLVTVKEAYYSNKRKSQSTFIIEKSASKPGFYYFQCNAGPRMEVVDLRSLMDRLQIAIKSHREHNVLTHRLDDMENDYILACDGLPRLFIHAVAWVLANDMKVEGPFRKSGQVSVAEDTQVLVANGYMPLYTSNVPEAMIKKWLQEIPGCVIDYKEEDWRINSPANSLYELATTIESKMNVSQRKMLAVMVALAHCIVRHGRHTNFTKNSAIAVVFGQNVFSLRNIPATDLLRVSTSINDIFVEIMNRTSTPEEFRQMFFSLFPGTAPPVPIVVARPVPAAAPVTGAPVRLGIRATARNRADARRKSRAEHIRLPVIDVQEVLRRATPPHHDARPPPDLQAPAVNPAVAAAAAAPVVPAATKPAAPPVPTRPDVVHRRRPSFFNRVDGGIDQDSDDSDSEPEEHAK